MSDTHNKWYETFWEAGKWFLIALVLWQVAGFVLAVSDFDSYVNIFSGFAGNVVPLIIFVVAGYIVYADNSFSHKKAFWFGVTIGVIVGILSSITIPIMMEKTPLIDYAVNEGLTKMAEQGQTVISASEMQKFIEVSMRIGIVIGPITSGFMGGLFTWLGSLFARWFGERDSKDKKKVEKVISKKTTSTKKKSTVKKTKKSKK